jgi:hypothetical protein
MGQRRTRIEVGVLRVSAGAAMPFGRMMIPDVLLSF